MTYVRPALMICLSVLGGGCTAPTMRPNAVSSHTRSNTLALGAITSGGAPLRHDEPIYPASALTRCPATVEVAAQVTVDEHGVVVDVTIPPGTDPAFAQATQSAARQWSYQPLLVTHWAADAHGESHTVDSAARPFRLDYVVHFTCREGQVEVNSTGGD